VPFRYTLFSRSWVSPRFPTGLLFDLSRLEFRQFSFHPVSQPLRPPLDYLGLSQVAFPPCYFCVSVSCPAEADGLVGMLTPSYRVLGTLYSFDMTRRTERSQLPFDFGQRLDQVLIRGR